MNKRRVLFCFYSGNIEQDMALLEDFESKGYEVELFTDLDPDQINLAYLPDLLTELYGNAADQCDFYIGSNMEEFICLSHILYKQLVKGFLYLNQTPVRNSLEVLYAKILQSERQKDYFNFYVSHKEASMPFNWIEFEEDFLSTSLDGVAANKIYTHEGINHVFCVSYQAKNTEVIQLDSSSQATESYFYCDLSLIDDYVEYIQYYANKSDAFNEDVARVYSKLSAYKKEIDKLPRVLKDMAKVKLDQVIQNNLMNPKFIVFLCSDLVILLDDKKYFVQMLDLIIYESKLEKETKYFIYYQCIRRSFINIKITDSLVQSKMRMAYDTILKAYSVKHGQVKLATEERNKNIVFIITSQLLGLFHAPTKMAIEVAFQMRTCLDKQVLIVNSKEFMPKGGFIPMSDIVVANEEESYKACNAIAYKAMDIALFQMTDEMPNDFEITKFLNSVSKHKPDMVISIGNSLLADLCSDIVPTVTIPTGRDGYSKTTFYAVDDEEAKAMQVNDYGRDPSSVIISRARFDLEAQRYSLEREKLGLQENTFVIGVIGTRLNLEIDDLFLQLLEKISQLDNIQILFVDQYIFSEKNKLKYPSLIQKNVSIGYQNDLKAALEHVDIYLNPFRNGGGVSALYAMDMGKPVVTLNKGDVSVTAGSEFSLNSVEAMYQRILRYIQEPEYYDRHRVLAKEKAFVQTDTCGYVREIYETVIESPLY